MHLFILLLTLQFGDGHQARILTVDLPTQSYEFHFNEMGNSEANR